jgi:hypothetical protein
MSDVSAPHQLQLDGASSALLSACGFAVKAWDFENATAQMMIEGITPDEASSLYALAERWREHLISVSLWHNSHRPEGHWDREFIAKRAKTTCEFELTPAQMRRAASVARAITVEFAGEWGWKELGFVLPGNIGFYDVDIRSFESLAEFLDGTALSHLATNSADDK